MSGPPDAGDVERFRDLIAARLGLSFDDGKLGQLAELLWQQQRAARLSCDAYLARLNGAQADAALARLAPALTIPETYFFRHVDQIRAFTEAAIPELVKARAAERRLRILSAACATGEEPYTLAMALRDAPIDPSWAVSVLAIDLNPAVLERAASGRFSSWSLRETPPAMQERWFRPSGRDFVLDEAIRRAVVFERHNLAEDDPLFWRADAFDVVFCRNVLMYFTRPATQAVIDRLGRSIAPGGYLFLGHAETLRGMSHEFHLCHTHNAFYYRRKGPDEPAARPAWTAPATPAPPALTDDRSWVESIGRSADRIRSLVEDRALGAPRPAAAPPAPAADLGGPLELLRQERYGDALMQVRSLPPESAADPDVRLLEAVLLAHGGQLARAAEACTNLLAVDELNAGAHYVLALCCEGSGDAAGAVEHDQVATYLDPTFAMPRLHLGLLARRAGDHAEARRELARALDLLHREDASRLLFFGGGFHRDALVALCRAEIIACGGRP